MKSNSLNFDQFCPVIVIQTNLTKRKRFMDKAKENDAYMYLVELDAEDRVRWRRTIHGGFP